MKSIAGRLIGWGVGLLVLGALAAPASAQIPIAACGIYGGTTSYILTSDLPPSGTAPGTCLTFTSNGTTVNLNGHSIKGSGVGTGITFQNVAGTTFFNNNTITGPGIIHDFGTCIDARGDHNFVGDVQVYNCEQFGIRLGNYAKCVECRVHDVIGSEGNTPELTAGITMGLGCLLESSIVETSKIGVLVGRDCKVWDLVVDTVLEFGLRVGRGTTVARTVISHYHDGPGLDYSFCGNTTPQTEGAAGCQDSSNSVTAPLSPGAVAILDTGAAVITDCGTNAGGFRYPGRDASVNCPTIP